MRVKQNDDKIHRSGMGDYLIPTNEIDENKKIHTYYSLTEMLDHPSPNRQNVLLTHDCIEEFSQKFTLALWNLTLFINCVMNK
jgi:hypothetical protein